MEIDTSSSMTLLRSTNISKLPLGGQIDTLSPSTVVLKKHREHY